MIGQTISHYAPKAHPSPTDGWRAPQADKILEKLGEGGTGVVYKVPNFPTSHSQRVNENLRIPPTFSGT